MSIPMIWTLLRTFLLYILYIVYSGLWRGIVCDIPGLEFIFPESTKISWVDSRYDNNSQSRQVSWQKFTELTGFMTKIPRVDRLYDKYSLSRQALWQQFPASTGFMTKIPFLLIIFPRNLTSVCINWHLLGYSFRLYFWNLRNTLLRLSIWSWKFLPSTTTSSK